MAVKVSLDDYNACDIDMDQHGPATGLPNGYLVVKQMVGRSRGVPPLYFGSRSSFPAVGECNGAAAVVGRGGSVAQVLRLRSFGPKHCLPQAGFSVPPQDRCRHCHVTVLGASLQQLPTGSMSKFKKGPRTGSKFGSHSSFVGT